MSGETPDRGKAPDPGGTPETGTPEAGETPETEWKRRKRLAAVFGDVLPETTSDERDESDSDTSEEWLKRQVPPHHG